MVALFKSACIGAEVIGSPPQPALARKLGDYNHRNSLLDFTKIRDIHDGLCIKRSSENLINE